MQAVAALGFLFMKNAPQATEQTPSRASAISSLFHVSYQLRPELKFPEAEKTGG